MVVNKPTIIIYTNDPDQEFLHEIFFLISQKNPSVTCSDSSPTGEPNLQRQQQKSLPIFFPQNACNFCRNIVQ